MPLETLFISGPHRGGKSMMARLVADEVAARKAHYLRLNRSHDGHTNAVVSDTTVLKEDRARWVSSHHIQYTPDRIFETLPEALRTVRRIERSAMTVIEADADPALRHAYPYDYRLFVMPPPGRVETVFRDQASASAALHQVMQDTAAFASEIFGMLDLSGLEDSVGVKHVEPQPARSGEYLEQLAVDDQQVRHFLSSPLGAEIASRIQLQPDYYGLVESDVAVINTGLGHCCDALDLCIKRLEKLLRRIRHDARRHSVLFWGDVCDVDDPCRVKLVRRLKSLLSL